jgi:LysM repeat protein
LADQTIPYQVQPGDTLFSLARQFGTSVDDLATANSLPDPNVIAAGQILQIPQPTNVETQVDLNAADLFRSADLLAYGDSPLPVVLAQTSVAQSSADPSLSLATAPTLAPPAAAAPAPVAIVPRPAPVLPRVPIPAPAVVTATPAALPPAPSPTPRPAPRLPILSAPYFTQFDDSIWADSNCGPTSLSMALGALGVNVDQLTLRHQADVQMGRDAGPANGVTWEALAYAARVNGIAGAGLFNGKNYRTWTTNDLKQEIAKGHPVLLLVRYWDLPDHVDSAYAGDHYIVGLGFDSDGNLIYNDPAFHVGSGADRLLNPSQLNRAWSVTAIGYVRTAMALHK